MTRRHYPAAPRLAASRWLVTLEIGGDAERNLDPAAAIGRPAPDVSSQAIADQCLTNVKKECIEIRNRKLKPGNSGAVRSASQTLRQCNCHLGALSWPLEQQHFLVPGRMPDLHKKAADW